METTGHIAGWRALRTPLPHLRRAGTAVLVRALLFLFGRTVEVRGAWRLARLDGPVIFALNHSNAAEAALVPAALVAHRRGRLVRFCADWMFLRLPILGWLLRQGDPIPVYTKPFRWRLFEGYRRKRRERSPVDAATRALAAGDSVGLFPEGTRNPDPHRLLRGRPGLGHLVLATDAPVVPVGIHYPAGRRRGRAPAFGRAVVRVGCPMDFAEERAAAEGAATEAEASAGAGGENRRRLSRQIVTRVMAELAKLSGKRPPLAGGARASEAQSRSAQPGSTPHPDPRPCCPDTPTCLPIPSLEVT